MKRINVMKKIKIWLLVTTLLCSSIFMYGCKGAKEEERANVVVQKDTTKSTDESETTQEKKTTESESTVEKDSSEDDKSNATTESGGEESGESKKDEQQSSEESTTPMNEQTGTQGGTSGNEATDNTTTAPTVAPTTAPTTVPTVAPTTAPTTATTTAPQNYGSVINKLSYDANTYSRRGYDASVKATAESVISSILSTSMTEVERVRAIHDYLVKNVNYDYATANNISNATGTEPAFTAYGALVNKLAVCEGYSEAFLLLCWTAGIEVRIIEGNSYDELGNPVGHEWNVVKIGGKWYQVDVTWDDPGTIVNGTIVNDSSGNNLRYDYFLITTADMSADHTITACYNDTMPSCTSTDYYEYAKQCTFDVKLGSTPYVIISNYAQADSAVTSYNNQGMKKFAFIYVENSLDYNTLLNNACNLTVQNLNVGVSAQISVQASIGYSIAIITLTY